MKFTVSNILLMFEPAQNYFRFGKFFELGISGIFPCRRMFIMFPLKNFKEPYVTGTKQELSEFLEDRNSIRGPRKTGFDNNGPVVN